MSRKPNQGRWQTMRMTDNQNPEQKARDHIDVQLRLAGWVV